MRVDTHVLDHGGNLIDACFLSALAALMAFRKPEVRCGTAVHSAVRHSGTRTAGPLWAALCRTIVVTCCAVLGAGRCTSQRATCGGCELPSDIHLSAANPAHCPRDARPAAASPGALPCGRRPIRRASVPCRNPYTRINTKPRLYSASAPTCPPNTRSCHAPAPAPRPPPWAPPLPFPSCRWSWVARAPTPS